MGVSSPHSAVSVTAAEQHVPASAAEQAKERDGAALQTSPSEPIVSFAICRCDVNRGGTFHKSSNTLGQRISFEWLDPPEPPLNVSRAELS